MNNIEELFEETYDQAKKWDDDFIKIQKQGTYQEVLDYCKKNGAKFLYLATYDIAYVIDQFTRNDISDEEKKKLCNMFDRYDEYIIDYEIKKDEQTNSDILTIKTLEGDIKVQALSKKMEGTLRLHPDLETNDRKVDSHIKTVILAMQYKNPCDLVTGYVYGKSDKSRYLHNWIERKVDNEDVVIDYGMNAIINKKGYYIVKNAKSIKKIYNKELRDNYEDYSNIIKNAIESYYIYDTYRDDLLRFRKQRRNI